MVIKQTVKKEQEIDVYQLGCKGWDTNKIVLTFCPVAFIGQPFYPFILNKYNNPLSMIEFLSFYILYIWFDNHLVLINKFSPA